MQVSMREKYIATGHSHQGIPLLRRNGRKRINNFDLHYLHSAVVDKADYTPTSYAVILAAKTRESRSCMTQTVAQLDVPGFPALCAENNCAVVARRVAPYNLTHESRHSPTKPPRGRPQR